MPGQPNSASALGAAPGNAFMLKLSAEVEEEIKLHASIASMGLVIRFQSPTEAVSVRYLLLARPPRHLGFAHVAAR